MTVLAPTHDVLPRAFLLPSVLLPCHREALVPYSRGPQPRSRFFTDGDSTSSDDMLEVIRCESNAQSSGSEAESDDADFSTIQRRGVKQAEPPAARAKIVTSSTDDEGGDSLIAQRRCAFPVQVSLLTCTHAHTHTRTLAPCRALPPSFPPS